MGTPTSELIANSMHEVVRKKENLILEAVFERCGQQWFSVESLEGRLKIIEHDGKDYISLDGEDLIIFFEPEFVEIPVSITHAPIDEPYTSRPIVARELQVHLKWMKP